MSSTSSSQWLVRVISLCVSVVSVFAASACSTSSDRSGAAGEAAFGFLYTRVPGVDLSIGSRA